MICVGSIWPRWLLLWLSMQLVLLIASRSNTMELFTVDDRPALGNGWAGHGSPTCHLSTSCWSQVQSCIHTAEKTSPPTQLVSLSGGEGWLEVCPSCQKWVKNSLCVLVFISDWCWVLVLSKWVLRTPHPSLPPSLPSSIEPIYHLTHFINVYLLLCRALVRFYEEHRNNLDMVPTIKDLIGELKHNAH